MTNWAVFDIDGTLLPGASLERLFLSKLLREGILTSRQVVYFALEWVKLAPHAGCINALKQNKAFFRNLPVDRVIAVGKSFFTESIRPRFSEKGLKQVQDCREAGYHIMLMSGAPFFLVENLVKVIHPDYVVAARLNVQAGRFTGKLQQPHPYGMEKKRYLLNLQDALTIDFSNSAVFANHFSDIHHMELFGRVVAVNPGWRLRRYALKQGWKVEFWR